MATEAGEEDGELLQGIPQGEKRERQKQSEQHIRIKSLSQLRGFFSPIYYTTLQDDLDGMDAEDEDDPMMNRDMDRDGERIFGDAPTAATSAAAGDGGGGRTTRIVRTPSAECRDQRQSLKKFRRVSQHKTDTTVLLSRYIRCVL